QLAEPGLAEAIVCPDGVGDAVGVEDERLAGCQLDARLEPAGAGEGAEQWAGAADRLDRAVADHEGKWVAGRADRDVAGADQEAEQAAEGELRLAAEDRVETSEDQRRLGGLLADDASAVANHRRHRRGRDALAGDVPDQDQPAAGGGEDVVEVRTDLDPLAGGPVDG